jgi:molybdopterin-guanine dinucleotide biosynthesis protein A
VSEGDGLLGAVLAGGAGRRYGGPKAGATVGGVRMVERAVDALSAVCPEVVVVSSRPVPEASVPVIPDVTEGAGPLAGLEAALLEAERRGLHGVVLLACDLPLVSAEVVGRIASLLGEGTMVAPERLGGGVEPLCAAYGVGILDAVQTRLASDDRSLHRLVADVDGVVVPNDQVAEAGVTFLNVNTPADRERAEAALARGGGA